MTKAQIIKVTLRGGWERFCVKIGNLWLEEEGPDNFNLTGIATEYYNIAQAEHAYKTYLHLCGGDVIREEVVKEL